MQRKVYPVSMVNRYVKQLFMQDMVLQNLWVSGEVSNFKRHTSGHLYFTLKDEQGSVSAVMFAGDARQLRFRPENGQQVQAQGYVSLYEKTGQYQLYVRQMEPVGNGSLYLAFEALKEKLKAQGLFDEARKKPIAPFPRQIGIVTSPTGAALRDLMQIAKRRSPGVQLVLYPALVQGAEAAATIVEGIRRLDQMPEVDTIIIGRGGGAMEDLWPFNEESVALAVAGANTPIISAVGHETDFTIADFVADMRAPTPSAAAELAVPEVSQVLSQLDAQGMRQQRAFLRMRQQARSHVELLGSRVEKLAPRRRLAELRQQLDMLEQQRYYELKSLLQKKRAALKNMGEVLELLSPMHPLERGYALLSDAKGKVITGSRQVEAGQVLQVQMKDGRIMTQVQEIRPEVMEENSNEQ